MRVFLGIIIGVFLTIGSVYVIDSVTTGPESTIAQTDIQRRPMVNWEVVGRNWQVFTERVRYGWNRLAAG